MGGGTRFNWLLVMSENLLVSAVAREVSQWMRAVAVVVMDGWVGRKEQWVKTQGRVSREQREGEGVKAKGVDEAARLRCEFASRCLSSASASWNLRALCRRLCETTRGGGWGAPSTRSAIGLIHKPHVLFRPFN